MSTQQVTVVITSFNYSVYIKDAIESVLRQSYKDLSLIIIDDGSTDDSLDVINAYKSNPKVKIISRENRGIVFTRNEALSLVDTTYLLFLDADDYFDKDYVENMVKIAESTSADVVYPNWRVFGDDNYIKKFSSFSTKKLIRQEIHCTAESLIRVSATNGHRFESEEVAEDWDFFLGLALAGKKFVHAPDCYINYRVRKNTRGTKNPYWKDVRSFCQILLKWQERYPGKVDPFDLPIYAGKLRDQHIRSQDKIIKVLQKEIDKHSENVDELQATINDLRRQVMSIEASKSYKVGRIMTYPLRKIKRKHHE